MTTDPYVLPVCKFFLSTLCIVAYLFPGTGLRGEHDHVVCFTLLEAAFKIELSMPNVY